MSNISVINPGSWKEYRIAMPLTVQEYQIGQVKH